MSTRDQLCQFGFSVSWFLSRPLCLVHRGHLLGVPTLVCSKPCPQLCSIAIQTLLPLYLHPKDHSY